jgi:hypothetical protein
MTELTLNSFLKQECANYVSDGCLGVDLIGKGFNIDGKCWILKDHRPCKYFEESVLGVAKYLGCFDKIFSEYQNINLAIKMDQETRVCECGNELLKRERLCLKCKAKKRRDAYKKYNENRAA